MQRDTAVPGAGHWLSLQVETAGLFAAWSKSASCLGQGKSEAALLPCDDDHFFLQPELALETSWATLTQPP